MLRIRDQQLAVFSQAAVARFEAEMVTHIQEYFPVDYALAGEAQVRRYVREGTDRAMGFGIQQRGEVCRFLDLGLTLGSHFEEDPLLPWAAEPLSAPEWALSRSRMEILDEKALAWIEDVLGDDGEPFQRALLRAKRVRYETEDAEGFEATTTELLTRLHPNKVERVEPHLPDFFQTVRAYASSVSISSTDGRVHLAALMFLLGTHVVKNPLFSWVKETLDDAPEDADRGRALYDASIAFLERALNALRAQG